MERSFALCTQFVDKTKAVELKQIKKDKKIQAINQIVVMTLIKCEERDEYI